MQQICTLAVRKMADNDRPILTPPRFSSFEPWYPACQRTAIASRISLDAYAQYSFRTASVCFRAPERAEQASGYFFSLWVNVLCAALIQELEQLVCASIHLGVLAMECVNSTC